MAARRSESTIADENREGMSRNEQQKKVFYQNAMQERQNGTHFGGKRAHTLRENYQYQSTRISW